MATLRTGFLVAAVLTVSEVSRHASTATSPLEEWRAASGPVTILVEGFESGDACNWTSSVGMPGTCTTTVVEVQTGAHSGDAVFTELSLTAFSADRKHFWAADSPMGAEWNGVYFFRGAGATALDGSYQLGSSVDVTGTVEEFDPSPPGETLTQILVGELTLLSAGPPPAPLTGVAVLTLGSLAAGEPYEGVLVLAATVKVVASATSDRLTLADNSGNTFVMDDLAFDYSAASYPIGTCFSTVTGVMHVNGFDDMRIFLPRSPADLIAGSGCL